ncbi:helix-turn-helix domain-containing protein [Nannocystis pusilla]
MRVGSIIGAAKLLGITRHALRRRMTKLRLVNQRPRPG